MNTNKNIRTGDLVKLKVVDLLTSRYRHITGLCVKTKHKEGSNATFTIRTLSTAGVIIYQTFPLSTNTIEEVGILKRNKVKKSHLYHLDNRATSKNKAYYRI